MTGLRVAVIQGGPSAEAEVSRVSASAVVAALGQAGHQATAHELEASLPRALARSLPDVVFPATHGPLGEDGCLQGLLEVLCLRYVGSGVLASALCASKPHAKRQLRAAKVPVADDVLLVRGDSLVRRVPELRRMLGSGLVLKPAAGGSALGVELVSKDASDAMVVAAAERAFEFEETLLVEPFVPGREVTCGVLEGAEGASALPPTWISPRAAAHYDFASKYRAGGSEHVCPAPFAPSLVQSIQETSVIAHRILGCRDLSRVDFVVDDVNESFVVLEVNTLPGMTATSLFPEAAAVAGIDFPQLCDLLVRRAEARAPRFVPNAPAMP